MTSKYPVTKRKQSLARSNVGDSWIWSEYLWEDTEYRNSTHLQPVHGDLQRVNRIPCSTEDTEYFQPEQKLRLQEPMDGRGDRGYVGWYLIRINEADKVRVP